MIPAKYNGNVLNELFINEQGQVFREVKGEFVEVNQTMINSGYARISFKGEKFLVHRLMAFSFLESDWSPERNDVNHKDFNKLNNNLANLEWVSRSENMQHFVNATQSNRKPVFIFNLKGELVHQTLSMTEAAEWIGVSSSLVCNALSGVRKTPILNDYAVSHDNVFNASTPARAKKTQVYKNIYCWDIEQECKFIGKFDTIADCVEQLQLSQSSKLKIAECLRSDRIKTVNNKIFSLDENYYTQLPYSHTIDDTQFFFLHKTKLKLFLKTKNIH